MRFGRFSICPCSECIVRSRPSSREYVDCSRLSSRCDIVITSSPAFETLPFFGSLNIDGSRFMRFLRQPGFSSQSGFASVRAYFATRTTFSNCFGYCLCSSRNDSRDKEQRCVSFSACAVRSRMEPGSSYTAGSAPPARRSIANSPTHASNSSQEKGGPLQSRKGGPQRRALKRHSAALTKVRVSFVPANKHDDREWYFLLRHSRNITLTVPSPHRFAQRHCVTQDSCQPAPRVLEFPAATSFRGV